MRPDSPPRPDPPSEDWYADFLLSWLRSLPAVWRVSTTRIDDALAIVRADEHAVYERDGVSIAAAAARVLIDLGHEPPDRPTAAEVRVFREDLEVYRDGCTRYGDEAIRALQRASASADPRRRMLAAALLAGEHSSDREIARGAL